MKKPYNINLISILISFFGFLVLAVSVEAALVFDSPYLGPQSPTTSYISFITDAQISSASIAYGTTTSYGSTVSTYEETSMYDGLYRYDIQLTGLSASTTYHYKLTVDGSAGNDYSFKTLVAVGTRTFKFIVVGDVQYDSAENSGLYFPNTELMNRILDYETDVNVIVRNGDQVMATYTRAGWEDTFFDSSKVIGKKYWQAPLLGNHEGQGETGGIPTHYLKNFKFPTNITNHAHDGYYYSFDIGSAHIIMAPNTVEIGWPDNNQGRAYNTAEYSSWTTKQTQSCDWMVADADDARARGKEWVIVINHSPMYSTGGYSNHATTELQTTTQGTFRAAIERDIKADIMFSGHSHIYMRTLPTIRAELDSGGTRYIVTGGATSQIRDITGGDDGVSVETYIYQSDDSWDSETRTDFVPNAKNAAGQDLSYKAAAGGNYNRYAANHYILVEVDGNEITTTMKYINFVGSPDYFDAGINVYDVDTWDKTLLTISNTYGATVSSSALNITGTAEPKTGRTISSVTCPGKTVTGTTSWSFPVTLVPGINTFEITATDSTDYADVKTYNVVYEPTSSEPIAFPGAEGYGKYSIGGRGGTVYHVTNLNDSGDGSFRAACEASGPRYVVFDVAGVIELDSPVIIDSPYITIAGETAPEGGITLYGVDGPGGLWTEWASGTNPTVTVHDIIMRYIRIRGANDGDQGDALRLFNVTNAIIDHCSFAWASDETADLSMSRDITLQRNIFSNSLDSGTGHNLGVFHCYGLSGQMSMHHNLLAHHNYRLPVSNSDEIDIVNNVMYNWRDGATAYDNTNQSEHVTTFPHSINVRGNYYKKGLNSRISADDNEPISTNAIYKYYLNDNYYYSTDGVFSYNTIDHIEAEASYTALDSVYDGTSYITTETVTEAYTDVLGDVGANLYQDQVDTLVLSEVAAGTGEWRTAYTESQLTSGLTFGTAGTDSDNDGMLDSWEISTFGDLSKTATGDEDSDGYDNIEEYLHYLAGDSESETPAAATRHCSGAFSGG